MTYCAKCGIRIDPRNHGCLCVHHMPRGQHAATPAIRETVARLYAEGLSGRAIAENVCRCRHTVNWHIREMGLTR